MAYIGNVPAEKYTALTQQTFSSPTGTSFVLSQSCTNSQDIALFIDNVRQNPDSYSVSGTSLTTSTISSPSTMYCLFNGRTTETVNPPDDSVGASQLTTNAVSNSAMADDAVGIAELSATGTPSSTTFLAGNNTWSAPAGDTVLLETITASSDATILIGDGLIDSTYRNYKIIASNVIPATDSVDGGFRVSIASTVQTGGSYRFTRSWMYDGSTSHQGGVGTTATNFAYWGGQSVGSATGENTNFEFTLYDPSSANNFKMFSCFTQCDDSNGSSAMHQSGGYFSSGQAAVDAIQFYFSSGNVESGFFKLYGMK
jgi:hypothetical protein